MKLSGCSWSCSVQLSRKPKLSLNLWQKPELSLNLLWKPELSIVVAKTTIKHEVAAKASIFIAFGYKKKNNPARRAGEKNNLALILSEKKFPAQT